MSAGYIRRMDDLSRVVIPKDFRNIYRWRPDDELEFCPTENGLLIKKRANTNADRIRAMSDEELAERMLSTIDFCHSGLCRDGETCRGCMLKWLQQPVEEEAQNEDTISSTILNSKGKTKEHCCTGSNL